MKLFAYYLPQFHRVPENDKYWGEGFTEWTAAKNAKPLFEGHYQPHEPLNDNYYDLLEKETMQWQAALMHQYGIDGMCFYHYWFGDGKRVLEKPAENLLKWADIDMPFCFCWANETWLQSWSNLKGFPWMSIKNEGQIPNASNVIFQQKYGREEEWSTHFHYLLPFFKDIRYIRYEGKPIIVIYRLNDVGCLNEMIRCWERLARENGLDGLYVVGCGQVGITYGVDTVMVAEPADVVQRLRNLSMGKRPALYSYREAYETILNQKYPRNSKMIDTADCSFDNVPRWGERGHIFYDSSPELFEEYLAKLMAKNASSGIDFLFINAWNEWGEGMYLEPDKKYGYQWLEAVQKAKSIYKNYIPEFMPPTDDMDLHMLRCYCRKHEMYTNIFSDWMGLREKNKKISSYFHKYGVKKILIYGYGLLAKHLIWECEEQGISVAGVIDRERDYEETGIVTYRVHEALPDADGIIVAACYYMNDIFKEIRKYNEKIPIYSLSEIIYEMDYL